MAHCPCGCGSGTSGRASVIHEGLELLRRSFMYRKLVGYTRALDSENREDLERSLSDVLRTACGLLAFGHGWERARTDLPSGAWLAHVRHQWQEFYGFLDGKYYYRGLEGAPFERYWGRFDSEILSSSSVRLQYALVAGPGVDWQSEYLL